MNFHFRHDDPHCIVHNATDECAGYVVPLKNSEGFSLHRALTGIRDKIAVIKSIDEAIPSLAACYETHPPKWKRERVTRCYMSYGDITFTAYDKWTFYGVLSVESQERGRWLAYRGYDPLVDEVGVVSFATSKEAMRAADLHMSEGFRHLEPTNDGFSW
jgi:hypothetical protein